jgi:hypothetical protein
VTRSRIIVVILQHTSVIRYSDQGERDKAHTQDNRPEQIGLHQDFHPSKIRDVFWSDCLSKLSTAEKTVKTFQTFSIKMGIAL